MYAGILDGYNSKIHWGGESIGTIVPQNSRFGLTNGYKIIEIVYEDLQDVSVSERCE